jgi:putative ABC transport system permease protein
VSYIESIHIAWRMLSANRARSGLTVLGIVVGVAAVVCMVAVGAGARSRVTEKIRGLGTNILYIVPGAAEEGGARLAGGTRQTLTDEDASAILREVVGIEIASPMIFRTAQVIAGNRNWSTTVTGNDSGYLLAREWGLVAGRHFNEAEIESAAKVVIIGQVLAEKLFDNQPRLGDTLRIGSVPFTIIGVLDKKGQNASGQSRDDVAVIPLTTARSRVPGLENEGEINRRALDFIIVKFYGSATLEQVKQQVTGLLRQRHRLKSDAADDFSIYNPADVLAAQKDSARVFGILLASIASVALIVGGISIMNIMLVSVSERMREIGLRMAVGARRRDIRRQFLIEATVLAIIGGAIGIAVGSAAAIVVALYSGWPVLISPWVVVLACGFSTLVGLIFGAYPASRAAQLDPMVALRYE